MTSSNVPLGTLTPQEQVFSSLTLPRFEAIRAAQDVLPPPTVNGLYEEFFRTISFNKVDLASHPYSSRAAEVEMEFSKGLSRIMTSVSRVILGQLESVPSSYFNTDIQRTLQYGAFQVNFDDFSAYWQGIPTGQHHSLDAILQEAVRQSDFPLASKRIDELVDSIAYRLSGGICDIPGFDVERLNIGNFVTLGYKAPSRL